MPVHVALLRGINLGNHHKVPMKDLRAALEAHGFVNVRTYIQSGNVVFEAPRGRHGAAISKVVEARFGHIDVPVMMRRGAELTRVEAVHPFALRGEDITKVHVTFLDSKPTAAALERLADFDTRGDELEVIGKEVYLFCPNGYGRTKLTNKLFERRLGVAATTRNFKTVRALAGMVAG